MNKVVLCGHLGKDPSVKYTSTGQAISSFTIATNESWVDKNGDRHKSTEWHSVIVWGKLAELCKKNLTTGNQVLVEGSLQTSRWEDKDGTKRSKTEINAKSIEFIGKKTVSEEQSTTPDLSQFSLDDVPF